MRTWASDAGLVPASRTIDRGAGEGPPACCLTRRAPADGLAWWGGMAADVLTRARARLPRLAAISDAQLYLCGGCVGLLIREERVDNRDLPVVSREEVARGYGLGPRHIAKAWLHDEEFWRRGPGTAPAEVRAQSWWSAYAKLAAETSPGRLVSEVKRLLRESEWSAYT